MLLARVKFHLVTSGVSQTTEALGFSGINNSGSFNSAFPAGEQKSTPSSKEIWGSSLGRQRGWSSSQGGSALTQDTFCTSQAPQKSPLNFFFPPPPFPSGWVYPHLPPRGRISSSSARERKAQRGGVISFISFFISSLLRVAGIDVQCICHLIVLPMKMCVHSTDTGENSTLYTLEGIQRSVTEKKKN